MSLIRSHAPGLAARRRVSGSTTPSLLSTRRVSFNREKSCRLLLACTPGPGSADRSSQGTWGTTPLPTWEGALRALVSIFSAAPTPAAGS